MKKLNSNTTIVITIAAVLSIPLLFAPLSGSLDDSWKFAIHNARLTGLVFGTDVVFTFGPLGYLTYPLYIDRGLWLHTLLYTMLTHLLFWGAIYWFLKRYRAGLPGTIYVAAAIVVFMQGVIEAYGRAGEVYNYFYLLLMAYGYLLKKEKNILLLAVIALVSSMFFYIKFSFGLAVCCMFVTFTALLAMERRYKEATSGAVMFLMFTVISGVVMTGSLGALGAFFYNSWSIADGYVDAMAVDGPAWKLYAALFAWLVYGAFLLRSRRNYSDMRYLVLALGVLFINYKHSAGNGSIFEWDFFVTWGLVFTLYYVKKADDGDRIRYAALAVSLVLVVLPVVEFKNKAAPVKQILNSRVNQLKIAVELIKNTNPSMPYELNRQALSDYYVLSPMTLDLLKGHTVDIYTVDAALAGYYGLRWRPRPVFQSYSAYTAYLDSLNERSLSSAPEFILYAQKEFDGKSAVLFEPATYRRILTDYRVVVKDGIFWVLQRRGLIEPAAQEGVSAVSVPLGGKIPFSLDVRYYTFARVYVKYNIMGKIIRLLYRAPGIYIEFHRAGQPVRRYKFCFNAVNGINLDPFTDSADAAAAGEFAITTPYPGFFDESVKVEFFRQLKR
ncbi:MAG: hypothetical protein H7843_12095 [Nitrospirota bacterium]